MHRQQLKGEKNGRRIDEGDGCLEPPAPNEGRQGDDDLWSAGGSNTVAQTNTTRAHCCTAESELKFLSQRALEETSATSV